LPLVDPAPPGPVLTDPVLVDPLSTPAPAAGGVLSVGLLPVPPVADGLDVGTTAVGALLLAGVDTDGVSWGLADWGLADLDGWAAELVEQLGPVAPAACLPLVALPLDFAEAVVLASAVAVAVTVTVAVAVPVAVAVALPPELPLVPAGLLTELAGGALGVADLAAAPGLVWADDGEPDEHGVTGTLLWTSEVPAPPAPPAGAFWLADPFRVGVC
jgi:hypothetical protein